MASLSDTLAAGECDSNVDCDATEEASKKSIEETTIVQSVNLCETEPCENNGACVFDSTDNTKICNCEPGYTGDLCETDIDECDQTSSFWTGSNVLPTGITSVCMTASSRRRRRSTTNKCTDNINGYSCQCMTTPVPYSGNHCELDTFCENAECSDGASCSNGVCNCGELTTNESGREGTLCQLTNYCLGTDNVEICLNLATCVSTGSGVQCNCVAGFYGEHCESVDYCEAESDDFCSDHGYCKNEATEAVCVCTTGYLGDNCEHNNLCSSATGNSPCVEGSCEVSTDFSTYTCTCNSGFYGTDCDNSFDTYFCSNRAPSLSGFAACVTANTEHCTVDSAGTGRDCNCKAAWDGDVCDTCASGFYGTDCDHSFETYSALKKFGPAPKFGHF